MGNFFTPFLYYSTQLIKTNIFFILLWQSPISFCKCHGLHYECSNLQQLPIGCLRKKPFSAMSIKMMISFFDKYVYNFTDLMKQIQSNDFISNNFALNGYFLGALYSTLFFVLPTL